jgi:hypothetical protein
MDCGTISEIGAARAAGAPRQQRVSAAASAPAATLWIIKTDITLLLNDLTVRTFILYSSHGVI